MVVFGLFCGFVVEFPNVCHSMSYKLQLALVSLICMLVCRKWCKKTNEKTQNKDEGTKLRIFWHVCPTLTGEQEASSLSELWWGRSEQKELYSRSKTHVVLPERAWDFEFFGCGLGRRARIDIFANGSLMHSDFQLGQKATFVEWGWVP